MIKAFLLTLLKLSPPWVALLWLLLCASAYADCPNGLADLQGDYTFELLGFSATTGIFGYGAAGVMSFDGNGGIAFPDAVDSNTPSGAHVDISGSYRVDNPAHCVWRMSLHVPGQDYELSLDGQTNLVGAVLVKEAFLVLNAHPL